MCDSIDQRIGWRAIPDCAQIAREATRVVAHASKRGHTIGSPSQRAGGHPSEPNYLWMVAGENFGVLNDNDPGAANHIATTSHLADQLEAAGLSWKSYQESLGTTVHAISS